MSNPFPQFDLFCQCFICPRFHISSFHVTFVQKILKIFPKASVYTLVISKVLHTVRFVFKMILFYKLHPQAFNAISIVLYHNGPTFGEVLYSCQDAFVVDASDCSGPLIRHLLNASEAFPTEWFLKFWEQVKDWWPHVRTVRRVGKHLPSILFQNFRYCI